MINSVVLVGRLTRDPELRKTNSGMSVASFTLAVDDSFRGQNGEKVTIFMPVSVWGKSADNVAKFTRKGSLVGVTGRLTQRKYVRRTDNVEVSVTEVSAASVEFLDPKDSNRTANANSGFAPDASSPEPASQVRPSQESKNLDSIDVVDDDLPF
ncbi:MAG TPA: single-stranded DNA-binding protein [Firmicutes bacterium]|nr:single-stranded DNA-binding protein [Bacillota bacterium]